MREIKFRAWDKARQQFINLVDIDEVAVRGNGKVIEWEGGIGEWIKAEYEICLYTGLKDKNGKEIYEGDILEYCPAREIRSVIKWGEFGFGECLYGYKASEVIGNICENPELLK